MSRLIYEGSVKNLWQLSERELEFRFTDAYSVFDWGRMPDDLPGKGDALARMGAFFFERLARPDAWASLTLPPSLAWERESCERELAILQKEGLASHYLGEGPHGGLKVRRVAIERPRAETIGGALVHVYGAPQAADRLIPLEVVFRLGMPAGSSLFERFSDPKAGPAYARTLGLAAVPEGGKLFPAPVIEFFTKLEETDRHLSTEQAINYSHLDPALFRALCARTLLVSLWLSRFFGERGLELWDGKLEWGLIDGRLALVDCIGPDELRLIEPGTGVQTSKEFLRQIHRPTAWFSAVKEAKLEAARRGIDDWKPLVEARCGGPAPLEAGLRAAACALYPTLARVITAGADDASAARQALLDLSKRMRACLPS